MRLKELIRQLQQMEQLLASKTADCGCHYHAEEGIPCEHDLALQNPPVGYHDHEYSSFCEVIAVKLGPTDVDEPYLGASPLVVVLS